MKKIKEELVSLETAKLAGKNGFDLRLASYNYSEEDDYKVGFNIYTKEDLQNFKIYPAPSQSLLQRWLRETHNLIVQPIGSSVGKTFNMKIFYLGEVSTKKSVGWTNDGYTYEQALEKGLQEGLKLIEKF